MAHQRSSSLSPIATALISAAALLLTAIPLVNAQSAVTPPGTGTSANPYQISELGHLVWMAENTASSYLKFFALTTDVDASATAGWNDAGTNTDILEGFKPIGTSAAKFYGTFEGNGHTIAGLAINRPTTDCVGLFGCVGAAGRIRNLGLINAIVVGSSNVGGLIGSSSGGASNCYTTATISGRGRYVGGLVGYLPGTLSNCYATGQVTGAGDSVGGLVGASDGSGGTISNCYATCAVESTATGSSVGGLVGDAGGAISNCYSTGAVRGPSETGGLVGAWHSGTTSNSYWDMQTSGQSTSAKGTGRTTAQMKQQAQYAWDFTSVWGIVDGTSYPYLRYSPPPFRLTINRSGPGNVTLVPASADGTYAPGTVVTLTATPDAPADGFFAWSGAIASGSPQVTMIVDGHKSIAATFGPWIEISSLTDMAKIGNDPGYPLAIALYRLNADIDASATATWNDAGTGTDILEGFKPIGTATVPFAGIFEGNGHTITGLIISRPAMNDVGLFGSVGALGQVRNLSLIGGAATGAYRVGGLVGSNSGKVSTCIVTGAVTGKAEVTGGLVGRNDGDVSNCHTTSAVSGVGQFLGGVVGDNAGTISDCHADGAVTGGWFYIGGLVGRNDHGTLSNCRAAGAVIGWGGYFGGLVGHNYGGTVSNCHSTGTVTRTSTSNPNPIGGLAGGNSGTMLNCYATGATTNMVLAVEVSVGGLVGNNSGIVSRCFATGMATTTPPRAYVGGLIGSNSGAVSDSFATGATAGANYPIGGLVGSNNGSVSRCYATGAVTSPEMFVYIGGLVGNNSTTTPVSDSYWDMQTSGLSTSAAGTGKTTAQMKQQATFASWDFANTWRIVDNITYPYLRSPADYGDFNRDGLVNRADLDAFTACVTGPAIPYDPANPPPGCTLLGVAGLLPADFDHDGDVDQSDFGIFQRCWSGTEPADPNCAN